ncbi:hypothetical protein [Spongorhabdus nitratireducens]
MQKVRDFYKALKFVDTILKIVIILSLITGFVMFVVMTNSLATAWAIFAAFLSWVIKVVLLGIGYTLVQIAENTAPEEHRSDPDVFIPEGDLEQQFILLYENEDNAEYISDSMHRTYKGLKENHSIPKVVLKTAIKNIRSKRRPS